jgi:hypothetical protein
VAHRAFGSVGAYSAERSIHERATPSESALIKGAIIHQTAVNAFDAIVRNAELSLRGGSYEYRSSKKVTTDPSINSIHHRPSYFIPPCTLLLTPPARFFGLAERRRRFPNDAECSAVKWDVTAAHQLK